MTVYDEYVKNKGGDGETSAGAEGVTAKSAEEKKEPEVKEEKA